MAKDQGKYSLGILKKHTVIGKQASQTKAMGIKQHYVKLQVVTKASSVFYERLSEHHTCKNSRLQCHRK